MSDNVKIVLKRFLRAFVAGTVASMIIIVPVNIQNFTDLRDWLALLILSGIIGGISGLLQAADKALRLQS